MDRTTSHDTRSNESEIAAPSDSHAVHASGNGEQARALAERFVAVRSFTEEICSELETEDYVVQSMTDASPTKWHLAHTTWFFETFLLREFIDGYEAYDDRFPYLFNSYYVQAGDRFTRAERGMLLRPTVETIFEFRRHVTEHVHALLETSDRLDDDVRSRMETTLVLGMNHEQQHQELMVTDILHAFSRNPLAPALTSRPIPNSMPATDIRWISVEEGIRQIGTNVEDFSFDNERPRHRYFIEPFELASRVVTNGEYLEFVAGGGYRDQLLWLSEGWDWVARNGLEKPIYWTDEDGEWIELTSNGRRPLDPNAPACHISYFEADAYARWAGARLPSEFEWEAASQEARIQGHFAENRILHPYSETPLVDEGLENLFGNVWEWTRSQYLPYPGYKAPPGALGEYNGKFMSNQFVLRGGSCATPVSHIRATYRNFFPATARWQFAGIRLTRDV